MMAHALPGARHQEGAEIAVDRGPGRKRRWWWQMAPLAAGSYDVEQPVEKPAHVGGPRPAPRLGPRDHRLDQAILVVAERLASAEVADQHTIRRPPHPGLQKGSVLLSNGHQRRRCPLHPITAPLSKRAVRRRSYRRYVAACFNCCATRHWARRAKGQSRPGERRTGKTGLVLVER